MVDVNNARLIERSKKSVWHPCTQMKHHECLPLIPISHGQGVWLYDFDGNRYLDAISSWWVNLFGHANEKINAALLHQLNKLEHVILAGFSHEPVVELSERLSKLALGNLGHCFFASDGASAIEIALKMSFHYWRNHGNNAKTNFVSLQNGYHGETLGALAVTDVALFKDTYAPLLRNVHTLPSPDWRNASENETAMAYAQRCAQAVEQYLAEHGETVAAFVIEPLIQCAAGMAMYDAEYLRQIRKICDQYHVHLIADEIAVGFGRTGTMFACEQAQIAPDFLCLSKGITAGYLPLSVVLTNDRIFTTFYDDDITRGFLHSHSYTGNALACRAALASLDIFEQDDVLNGNREKASYVNKACAQIRKHVKVKNFRNTGMIWAFDIDSPDKDLAKRFYQEALRQGLLLRPLGNTIYFMPPYVINNSEIDYLLEGTLAILDKI